MVGYNSKINHQYSNLCWNNKWEASVNKKENRRFQETEIRMENAMLDRMEGELGKEALGRYGLQDEGRRSGLHPEKLHPTHVF